MIKRWRRWVVVVTGGLLITMLTALPASAHASLQRTDPPDRSVLSTAPSSVDLTFDEPVNLPPQAVRVFDADGRRVPSETQANDATATTTFAEPLATGTFVVSWRVVSDDGHPIDGAFTFSVGAPTPIAVSPTTPEPSAGLIVALRIGTAVTDAGLLLTAGLGVFLAYLLPAGAASLTRSRQRLDRLHRGAGLVALLGTLAIIPLLRLWQDAGTFADLGTRQTWEGLASFEVLMPPLLVAAGLAIMFRGARRGWPVLAGGALALSSLTISGHTRAYGPPWLSYPLDLLHVGAGALWLGALVGITVSLWRSSGAVAAEVAVAVSRFSALALETILVLSAAGVIMASLILGSVSDLVDTAWGLTLIVKVGVVGTVLVVAAVNRWRLLPRVQRETEAVGEVAAMDWLRRTVRVEAIGLAVVLAITGVLVTQSPLPPAEAATIQDPTAPVTLQNEQPLGAGGEITFALVPVVRGTNTVTIVLTGADDQPLTPASPPTLQTRFPDLGLGPFEQQVTRIAPGTYRADVNLSYAGEWVLTFRIRLDTFTEATPQYPVTVR
ncbi:MAG: copper resistance protein CopC [Propionibacteriaceae bacterium]